MNRVRFLPETDLMIISGCVEPALARDFQDEWIDQLRPEKREKIESTPKGFFDEDYSIEGVLRRPELPATHRILQLLKVATMDDVAVGINFQSTLGAQSFHRDNPTRDGVVYVVNGADGGSFDYAPNALTEQEAEDSFLSVEVGAGDILLQTSQKLFHRGRNTSPSPRVTAAIARVDTDEFYDSYR